MARTPIGELLKEQQLIDDLQLQSAIAYQRKWGGRIGQAFVRLGFLQEQVLLSALGRQLGVQFTEIGDRVVHPEVLKLIPEKLMRQRRVLPLALLSRSRRGPLLVALSQPENLHTLDEISFATGFEVQPVLAAEDDIERALARHLDGVVKRAPITDPGMKALPDSPQEKPSADLESVRTEARRRRFH